MHGELLERIYASILDPVQWAGALDACVKAFGAEHALAMANPLAGNSTPFIARSGMDDSEAGRFLSPYAFDLGQDIYSRTPSDRVVLTHEIVSDAEADRSAYYAEIIRPNRAHYGMVFQSGGASRLNLFICRKRAHGAYGDAERSAFEAIVPHFNAALLLGALSAAARGWSTEISRLFDEIQGPTILADARARPLGISDGAAAILNAADGLSMIGGGLAGANSDVTAQLHRAIDAVAALGEPEQRLVLPRPSGLAPLRLRIVAFWRLGSGFAGVATPSVAIIIAPIETHFTLDRSFCRQAWDLTAREMDVVERLARGVALPEIAKSLGVGMGTVRSHLKSAFEKTGVSSQVALVALLRDHAF